LDQRITKAEEIYNRFLRENAPEEVNIDLPKRDLVYTRITSGDPQLFEDLNIEILVYLEHDIMRKFISKTREKHPHIQFSGNGIAQHGEDPQIVWLYKHKKKWNVFDKSLSEDIEKQYSTGIPSITLEIDKKPSLIDFLQMKQINPQNNTETDIRRKDLNDKDEKPPSRVGKRHFSKNLKNKMRSISTSAKNRGGIVSQPKEGNILPEEISPCSSTNSSQQSTPIVLSPCISPIVSPRAGEPLYPKKITKQVSESHLKTRGLQSTKRNDSDLKADVS
jgi:hypothetical protein